MKLQKKRDAELAAREGSAKTTIIYGIWFIISIALGYGLFYYLDSSGTLTMRALRGDLSLPNSIPEWVIMAVGVFLFVVVAQIALGFGFLIASPDGRRKAGKGDLRSRHKELDERY